MTYQPKTSVEQREDFARFPGRIGQHILDDLAACEAALAEEQERGKSGEDDDQMTDGWLRSIGGVEPDYTEDFTETTFIFDLDNDHCLNVEVDNQRVYIYDAGREHVAIELPHIKTCGQFLKLLFSGIRPPERSV